MGRPHMAPAQLVAYLRMNGFSAKSFDLSLRFCRWLSREGGDLDAWEADLARQYVALQEAARKGPPTRSDRDAARRLVELISAGSPRILAKCLGPYVLASTLPKAHDRPGAPRLSYVSFAQHHGIVRAPTMTHLLQRVSAPLDSDPFFRFCASAEGSDLIDQLSDCDIVGVSLAYWQQLFPSLVLARCLKERSRSPVVVFGGNQITLLPSDTLDELMRSAWVDFAVPYEGETPLRDLMVALRDSLPWEQVPSLIHVERDGTVRRNPLARPIDLDDLPTPEYDHEELLLHDPAVTAGDREKVPRRLMVLATRGCYWGKCAFCDYPAATGPHHTYRVRSPARVVDDIRCLQQRHGVADFELLTESLPPQWPRSLRPASWRATSRYPSARSCAPRVLGY